MALLWTAGRLFIGGEGRDIGVRETLDIAKFFIDSRKPKIPLPVNDETPADDLVAAVSAV